MYYIYYKNFNYIKDAYRIELVSKTGVNLSK